MTAARTSIGPMCAGSMTRCRTSGVPSPYGVGSISNRPGSTSSPMTKRTPSPCGSVPRWRLLPAPVTLTAMNGAACLSGLTRMGPPMSGQCPCISSRVIVQTCGGTCWMVGWILHRVARAGTCWPLTCLPLGPRPVHWQLIGSAGTVRPSSFQGPLSGNLTVSV